MSCLREQVRQLNTTWKDLLAQYPNWAKLEQDYYDETEKATGLTLFVFPKKEDTFNCFNQFDIEDTKLIIIGQDPYHGSGQANGLAFAVNKGVRIPPSLRNILGEITSSHYSIPKTNSDLLHWAQQGVLLLNTSLSVREGKPGSHSHIWKDFTQWVLSQLVAQKTKAIPVMWGAHAHSVAEKSGLVTKEKPGLVTSHPSPLSVMREYKGHPPFFNSKVFVKVNGLLKEQGEKGIEW